MKTIDLTLFENEDGLEIKTKNKTYIITFISSVQELKLMQNQGDISTKLSKWQELEQQTFEQWKSIIKNIIKEQSDQDLDEKDINRLKPLAVVSIMYALMEWLKERTSIVLNSLSEETKKEAKKIENEVKKKKIQELAL